MTRRISERITALENSTARFPQRRTVWVNRAWDEDDASFEARKDAAIAEDQKVNGPFDGAYVVFIGVQPRPRP